MQRYWHRDCSTVLQFSLHDAMTALLPYLTKSVLPENAAHFRARKDPKLTQQAPQSE